MIFSGESDKPEIVRQNLADEIGRIIADGLNEKDFARIKKSTYGSLIRELNNVEAVANLLINAHMDGVSPYDTINVLSELTSGDVYEFIKNELCEDKTVLSVIKGET